MTKSEALAKILESYTEEELFGAKDEPDTSVASTRSATVVEFHGGERHAANTIRRHVKRAFHAAGHGQTPANAIANARRIFKQDETP